LVWRKGKNLRRAPQRGNDLLLRRDRLNRNGGGSVSGGVKDFVGRKCLMKRGSSKKKKKKTKLHAKPRRKGGIATRRLGKLNIFFEKERPFYSL